MSAESVRMAAPRLIAAAASAVAGAADGSTAARLWAGLAARPRDDAAERVLDQALVLLVDHDLAVSTLAVRAAASARASVHAAVLSGLGALDSALHGNASAAAARLILRAVETGDADLAIAESVSATGRAAPGFGHVVYRDADPRAEFLLDALQGYAPAASVLDAVTALRTAVRVRTGRQPNVDLALGALVVASGMPLDAGPALFAIARMAGWIAHALDEYERPPLRLRPRGRYVGPPPSGLA